MRTGRWQLRQRWRLLATSLVATAVLGSSQAEAATPVPITYRATTQYSAPDSPSADKPQSKLWFNDGSWWALMHADNVVKVHRLDLNGHRWVKVGPTVDTRLTSTGDALWDEAAKKLYVASRTVKSIQVNRLSYAGGAYTQDAGFPVTVSSAGSESVTIAKDSLGRLWTTFTQGSAVLVAHTAGNDAVWGAPFRPPGVDTDVSADDLSAVTTFRGRVGIVYSDQQSQRFSMLVHVDTDPDTVWRRETAGWSGTLSADDHISLKNVVTTSGRLYVAVKTSKSDGPGDPRTNPQLVLLIRDPDGTWWNRVYGTVHNDHTRPLVVLDQQHRRLYLFATSPTFGPGRVVYYKSTSIDSISFAPGRGTPFVTSSGADINNVSGPKHPVNSVTDLVVLATDEADHRYYHSELSIE